MKLKLYDDDDLRSTAYREGEQPWEFIADIPGDNSELLDDTDNHDMLTRLTAAGVIGDGMTPDPETCCFYIYFDSETIGRKFIKGLNEYLLEKAKLTEAARSF